MTAREKGRPSKEETTQSRYRAFEILINGEELTPDRLQSELGCTPKTARRILAQFSDMEQRLARTQRGLKLGGTNSSYYLQSLGRNRAHKEAVAALMREVASSEASVAAGPGSTIALCAQRLRKDSLWPVIVTSNMGIVDLVGEGGVGIIELVGGLYDPATHACVGRAADGFRQANCQAAVVGVSGIDSRGGLHVAHSSEVPVLRALLDAATKRIYIVFDATKIEQTDTFEFSTIRDLREADGRTREIHLVTNMLEKNDSRWNTLKRLEAMEGVHLTLAGGEQDA
jgi:DeoR/GlpR family transcriptional regulator of sugar metabolism